MHGLAKLRGAGLRRASHGVAWLSGAMQSNARGHGWPRFDRMIGLTGSRRVFTIGLMRLFNFKIRDDLDARLKAESERTGAPMSEIVRRAIHEYLERSESDAQAPCRARTRTDAMATFVA